MSEPLAIVKFHHSTLELWPDCCATVFHADGKRVVAAPNDGETIIDTALHEGLHAAIAQGVSGRPSECLRAVADGDGQRWTMVRKEEEAMAFGLGPLVKALHEGLCRAYVTRDAEEL